MPKLSGLNKVMVIGSGPIIIGQAAEFDYAGTQACRSLKEESLEVVLVNSNPATIMTDAHIADHVYIEPLTPEFVAEIIRRERPDGLLPTLGGQVGLNLAVKLAEMGVLEECNVKLLGTPLQSIKQAEDRELFKQTMQEIGEPIPESVIVEDLAGAKQFADQIGYPLIVRPAYTLGGTGGGIVNDEQELADTVDKGLKYSMISQVLIERSVAGWKEVEYEVMRDSAGNCITVCNMENLDPVGVHTGDSIVVAPSQTLSDHEYQMLRSASLNIINALGIEGGCNVQFALDTSSDRYYVIEVNPRVSRSSALASKATGYPIAKVATKIAIGYHLDEIKNAVTQQTVASFEPALDYVVIKFPRWPFDKFNAADRVLGTQMKATGEVMAIDRTLESALMKAVRSLEIKLDSISLPHLRSLNTDELINQVNIADDERLFVVAECLRRGVSIQKLHEITCIDLFFLNKIENIVRMERVLADGSLSEELVRDAKQLGFPDRVIARMNGCTVEDVRKLRDQHAIHTTYKMVDTCAAEFEAATPYYYGTYESEDEVQAPPGRRVLVLGSGPIRIGQGIEFDYCSVHSVWALRELGIQSVIVNNNPETVSTDFDTSDRLYFEPLTFEDVMHVIEREQPDGVIAQFGGQTAINLAGPLTREGVSILGTSAEAIDIAEDRERFDDLLTRLNIPRPQGKAVSSVQEALKATAQIGYPVVVRPSYVLGGRAMEIVYNDDELKTYMAYATQINPEHPVLVDQYLKGLEVEVDAVADGTDVLIPGIMEHIERAGVHSGDSIAVYPAKRLSQQMVRTLEDYTVKLAKGLNVRGLINIQYVVYQDQVYVLEVNPRSSRTVPFLSKVTGIPMVNLATKVALGNTLAKLGYSGGLAPTPDYVAVKAPVFSFNKLTQVDISLGPEMKSTGEVMGIDQNYAQAIYKAVVASGIAIPRQGAVLATIADYDKPEALPILRGLADLGFELYATEGTAKFLQHHGLSVRIARKLSEQGPHILDLIKSGTIKMVINTFTKGKQPEREGFQIRRSAVENAVPCFTSLDTIREILKVLQAFEQYPPCAVQSIQEYQAGGLGRSNRVTD